MLGVLCGGSALAANNNVDTAFAPMAVRSGLAEVQDAQLAVEKTKNKEINRFAQRMIKDHSEANKDLSNILAGKKDLSQPSGARVSGTEQTRDGSLGNLEGKAFEKAYIHRQIQMHETAVKAFEHEAEAGADLDVRAFATKHLPMLREHLAMAKAIKIEE
jgi:putative membrane protein